MTRKRRSNLIIILGFVFAFVLTSAIIYFGGLTTSNTEALSTTTSIGSISYTTSRPDGLIFNNAILTKLYDKLLGTNGTGTYSALYTKVKNMADKSLRNSPNTNTITISHTMNFADIQAQGGVKLEFGGYTWDMVFLTTDTEGSSNGNGDLIATLWLSDCTAKKYQWSTATTTYPNNYSASDIRSSIKSDFSAFATGEYSSYLASPNQLKYQKNENFVWSYYGPDKAYLMPNEAWAKSTEAGGPSTTIRYNSAGGWNSAVANIESVTGYTNWGSQDKIWLPSLTETGYSLWDNGTTQNANEKGGSLWGIPDGHITRKSSATVWLRSGHNNPSYARYLTAGGGFFIGNTTALYAVRPAIHLNLKKVEETLAVPQDINDGVTYNGSAQNVDTLKSQLSWYHSSFSVSSAVKVEYLNSSGTTVLTGSALPKNQGNYKIRFTILDSHKWADNTTGSKTINFVIKPKEIGATINLNTTPHTVTPTGLCAVDQSLSSTLLYIQYSGGGLASPVTTPPTKVGTYTATAVIDSTVNSNGNYTFGTSTYNQQLVISPQKIDMPTVRRNTTGDVWATYDGNTHYYTVSYDSDILEITKVDGYDKPFDWDATRGRISVTNAGEYNNALKVRLKNPYTGSGSDGINVWDTTTNDVADKFISFTLEKMELKLDFKTDGDDGIITSPLSDTCSVNLIVASGQSYQLAAGDNVNISITAKETGMSYIENVADWIINQGNVASAVFDLDISELIVPTTYEIKIVTKNDNYNVVLIRDITLRLVQSTQSADLIWWLQENNRDTVYYQNVRMGAETETDFTAFTMVYDSNKAYSFGIRVPFGYDLDTDVVTTKKNDNYALSNIKDAGEYVSTVKIKKTGETTPITYTLNWSIGKALFDLSAVKWKNDGKLEYNNGERVEAVLENVPTGLTAVYSGTTWGTTVGGSDGSGTAYVAFEFADTDLENNFELPVEGQKGTKYKFDGNGDFAWSMEWSIVPVKIKLEWNEKPCQDSQSNPFNVLVLKDIRLDGKIDYTFFETDGSGHIKDQDNPLTLDQIEVSLTERKHYVAYPTVKSEYSANFEFIETDPDRRYSRVFSVGGGASGITVALDKNSIEYTGNPVSLKVNITGAATQGQLTLTYYSGDIVDEQYKLSSAPTNAGIYTVVITSNTSTVLISGTTQFEFEITKSIISTEWNTTAKPPVLNLKNGQLDAIQYIIVDSSNNTVESVNDIVAGEYAIKAKIKDSAIANFIFDDNTVETAYVQFTVREGDTLYDPTDPSNPFNPSDSENPPENPDEPIGGSFLDKIKEFIDSGFPLWQIATMAVAGLLTLIFLIKAMQYGNRAKKAKGEAKKLSAKTFALMPIFSTEVVLAGLTNQIWSIMAFSLAGAALLMFVIALVMRRSWKKAELAKETAAEDLEKRKEEKQLAKEEADRQERREFQERIAQVSIDGQSDNSASLIEQMRREMEERDAQHRQEMDAMKMMFANMMGRNPDNSEPIYGSVDDTELLVQKVIAGLLPTLQQMMPDTTAYLTAPGYEESEELKNLVEEQSDQIRNMTEQMAELQNQLAAMNEERMEAEVLPDQSEEIKALTDEVNELKNRLETENKVESSVDVDELAQKVAAQITPAQQNDVNLDDLAQKVSEKITPATTVIQQGVSNEEMQAMAAQMEEMRQRMENMAYVSADEYDDDDFDDEEEWDSILDEEEDDFVEAVVVEADGTVRKSTPNFRMRLKQSSDKNKEWYTVIKNMFCSQKGVTYRVCKRVEKIRYQGQVIGVIGIAKRSIKLWLALKPYEYDARRYHHKDVSDKPRFIDVPMYVRVGSDRGLVRAQELILALFQELNMEERKRYNDRSIQELIFTLKHNRLLANKQTKQLLCEVMHVHDCDDVLDDETAEKCVEYKNVDYIDDSLIATVKLDDIDAYFQDGNRVTLEKLKKAGLISEECTGYNVVADKRLTKPLIIVANDFSITAIKLIALTGGRAIKLQTV